MKTTPAIMNKVNEIRAEKIARNANPLALVAVAQYSHAPTKTKGKEVVKPRTPPSLSASKEDTNPEQAQGDKDMQKSIAFIAKTVTVAGERETVGNQDTNEESNEQELEAHNMHMAKIYEVLYVTDDNSIPTYDTEPLEQVPTYNEYNVSAKERQHFEQPESVNDTYVIEIADSNVIPDSSDMCNNEFEDDQNVDDNDEDERVELANLIANLKLDIDENKKIQNQLRKANTTLTQELNESKSALTESNDNRDRCRSALHQKEVELEKYITHKNCQLEKEEIERKYKETHDLLAHQTHQSHEALKTQAYETFQFKEKNDALIHQGSLEKLRYDLLRKEKELLQKDFKIS
ncbi:hypothetical protein Tco_0585186 [Tanacetum coccineum]